mgnify:CR=1 FL=1
MISAAKSQITVNILRENAKKYSKITDAPQEHFPLDFIELKEKYENIQGQNNFKYGKDSLVGQKHSHLETEA